MSLGLHLAALSGGCTMPPIAARSNSQINPLSSNNVGLSDGILSRHPHGDGLHAMKEYSLISHIESLKAVANGHIPYIKSNTNADLDYAGDTSIIKPADISNAKQISSSPCSQGFPQIVSLSQINDHLDYTQARPLSSKKWALDPDSVPGNIRTNSAGKQVSLTLEEILSCTSSSMAKKNDNEEDDNDNDEDEDNDDLAIPKRINLKQRRKSAKALKRKQNKNKELNKSQNQGGVEERRSCPSKRHSLRDSEKKATFHHSPLVDDIASITALCKGMKIQQKQPNSITVHQTPYGRKKSTVSSPQSKPSVSLKASLETAMADYAKKQNVSVSHTNLRRKVNSIDEEAKTTKIFLSEKQSGLISDCGASVPCAPPATPTPDQLKRYEYVPSLQDIRSQRSFRQRLQLMENRALKKEKKKHDNDAKIEKMSLREKRIEMKKKQRREIYALNKLMTDLEHERFKQFMLNAGSNL